MKTLRDPSLPLLELQDIRARSCAIFHPHPKRPSFPSLIICNGPLVPLNHFSGSTLKRRMKFPVTGSAWDWISGTPRLWLIPSPRTHAHGHAWAGRARTEGGCRAVIPAGGLPVRPAGWSSGRKSAFQSRELCYRPTSRQELSFQRAFPTWALAMNRLVGPWPSGLVSPPLWLHARTRAVPSPAGKWPVSSGSSRQALLQPPWPPRRDARQGRLKATGSELWHAAGTAARPPVLHTSPDKVQTKKEARPKGYESRDKTNTPVPPGRPHSKPARAWCWDWLARGTSPTTAGGVSPQEPRPAHMRTHACTQARVARALPSAQSCSPLDLTDLTSPPVKSEGGTGQGESSRCRWVTQGGSPKSALEPEKPLFLLHHLEHWGAELTRIWNLTPLTTPLWPSLSYTIKQSQHPPHTAVT